MHKILVLGNSGSGKSTFTAALAKKLNYDYLHLDTIVYKHNWTEQEKKKIDETILEFMKKDNWILDGNFLKKVPERFIEADTIFFLDINRFVCFFSVIKRYFKYKGKHRDSRSDLCDEKLTKDYLSWVFIRFYKTSRIRILNYLKNTNKKFYIFKNRRQMKKFLKEVKK